MISDKEKALLSGMFVNVAQRMPDGQFRSLTSGQTGTIHPMSTLFNTKPPCVLYDEMVHTTKLYLRGCTVLDTDWLAEVCPAVFRGKASG